MKMGNGKEIYISYSAYKMEHTPEENYDPRYYDLSYYNEEGYIDEPDDVMVKIIDELCGENSYSVVLGGVIYTEDNYVMRLCQNKGYDPVWFDYISGEKTVAEELREAGYVWVSSDREAYEHEKEIEEKIKNGEKPW